MYKQLSFRWLIFLLFLITHTGFALEKNITDTFQPWLLEVRLNETDIPHIVTCYTDVTDKVWVSEQDLLQWQLKLPPHSPQFIHQHAYYQLDWYKNFHYRLDKQAMRLFITAGAQHFPTKIIDASAAKPQLLRPERPGGFLNYDVAAIRNANLHQNTYSLLPELGVFNKMGVGTTSGLIYSTPGKVKKIRLLSTWTLDQPEHLSSWRFGDAISNNGNWSSSVQFGGIQYATNFATDPNLITFPLPGFKGEAVLPSTVNVFVNNVLSQQQTISNGPFVINNIPVISGAGTVSVVTQDVLGRNQIITLPYYASPALLKPGLSDFSYEAGWARRDYGRTSNHYSRALGVFSYRRGITDYLTLGSHIEVLRQQQTAGGSADFLLGNLGATSVAIAGSHSQFGKGALGSLGFSRQTTKINYGFKITRASPYYIDIGSAPPNFMMNYQMTQLFMGYNTDKLGSFSVGYTAARVHPLLTASFASENVKLVSLNYSRILFKNFYTSIGGIIDLNHMPHNQAFLAFSYALDSDHSLSSYSSDSSHEINNTLQLNKSLPVGNGYGYNLYAADNNNNRTGGDITVQNNIGTYTARYSQLGHESNYELDATGGVVYLGGRPFLSRAITQSFVVVQVPYYSNLPIYYQNQVIGRTDAQGNLLITTLLPYQKNNINLDLTDLPLNMTVTNTQKSVTPYLHSGALIRFDLQKNNGALLKLITPQGNFVPAGATVQINQNGEINHLPVGYEGTVFINNFSTPVLTGTAEWQQQQCHFSTIVPNIDATLLELGQVLCE